MTEFDLAETVREVRRNGGTRGILMRRRFPATVEQLWATCTEGARLARWIGRLEDAGDSAYRLVMGSTGEHVADLDVLRCEAPRLLELVWSAPDEADSIVRATIAAVDDGAELTIEHFALVEPGGLLYGAGWEEFMADLGEYLDGPGERGHDCDALESRARELWSAVPQTDDDAWGILTVERFRLVRTVAADADRVWASITTPDGLRSWFGDVAIDGPRWRVKFSDGSAHGVISACVDGREFTTTFVQDVDPEATHTVRIRLRPTGDGTEVTLEHTYAEGSSAKLRHGLASGWYAYLAALGYGDDSGWLADFRMATLVHR